MSLKSMFAPPEDFEENLDDQDDDQDNDEDDDAGWRVEWERMQEGASKETRKIKTMKRLRSNGEF